jgi:signal transduction histidine kinase
MLYKRSLEAEIKLLEKERGRIAADLHDDLGPLLSSVKLNVGSLDLYSERDTRTADRVYEHIDTMMQRMREISADMLPNTLERKGLIAAIDEFISNIRKPASLNIRFVHNDSSEFPSSQSIHIYRIVQEIIHNTIKHAQATELIIEIKQEGSMIVLLSGDNGKGFDYNLQSRENSGLGLRNLYSRTEMLGGNLGVESGRGKGTNYTIEIPLQKKHG